MTNKVIRTAVFAFSTLAAAQGVLLGQDASKDQKTVPATATPAPAGTTPAPARHLPQAKTQPEFDAYQAAMAIPAADAMEKAADDFATKNPASELRILLYKHAMQLYQNANNIEKAIDMGRKCLSFDPDDPEVLANLAQDLAEHTRSTDLDKDQKYDEAEKHAEKALQTVDTDLVVNPGTPQDQVDQAKGYIRSTAYGSLGIIYYGKDTKADYAKAEDYLRKSVAAFPSNPDPVTVLRLAIAIDKQDRYSDALVEANKAVQMTKEGTTVGDSARREQSRLQSLSKDLIK